MNERERRLHEREQAIERWGAMAAIVLIAMAALGLWSVIEKAVG